MSDNKNINQTYDRERSNRYENVDVINLDYYEGHIPGDVKNEPWDHLEPPRFPQSSLHSIKPEPSSSLLSESKFGTQKQGTVSKARHTCIIDFQIMKK